VIPIIGPENEPTTRGSRMSRKRPVRERAGHFGLARNQSGVRIAGAPCQNGTRGNYGDPEISCATFGEFAHEIGLRAPIEMKLAQ